MLVIKSRKSNGMSEKHIENITKSDSNFAPPFFDHHVRHCLVNNIYISKKVINLYISYTLGSKFRNLNTDFTLGNCLFGSVKLTKNSDLDKYKYSGYSIGFDSCSEFLLPDSTMGKNVIIFGADISLSLHVDNEGKEINYWRRTNTKIRLYYISSRSKISY